MENYTAACQKKFIFFELIIIKQLSDAFQKNKPSDFSEGLKSTYKTITSAQQST